MEHQVRKGRNDRTLNVPHSPRETTRPARTSNGRASVRARSSAEPSDSGGRMDSTRRETSDAASRSGPRASTMNYGGNRSRRVGNVPGRTNHQQLIRLARIRPNRSRATSLGRKGRKGRDDGAVAIPNSAHNRVTGDEAEGAQSPANNQEKSGGAGAMPSRVSGGRCAGRVVTMKRPNASRRRGPGTSVDGSRAAPCGRRPIPPAAGPI